MNSFKKLLKLISPEGKNIWQIYLLALFQGVFYLMVPLGIQAIITYTMAGQLSASLILLSLFTTTAVFFVGIFQLWQMRINETIQQYILVNVGVRFSEKIAVLNPELHLNKYLPSKINQFFDVITLQKGLSKILLEVSFSIISIVFGLLILLAYNPLFLVFTAIITVAFYFLARIYGQRSLDKSLAESKRKYMFVDWLQTLYQGLSKKNTDYNNNYIESRTNATLSEYVKEKSDLFRLLDVQYKSILGFKTIFTALLLFTGIWLVQAGHLNIGQFVAAEILVILVINAVEKLVINLETVYEVLTATEKISQVLEMNESSGEREVQLKTSHALIEKNVMAQIYNHNYTSKIRYLLYSLLFIGVVIMFLPWTQSVSANGKLSTLNPSERPQTIPSRISGRIEKWFVKEGDFVKKGDTIAFISEIKENYFDPKLIERTQSQLRSKESSIRSYGSKVNSIDLQIEAIQSALLIKTEQARNKVIQSKTKMISDSAEFIAAENNYKITEEQFNRFEGLLAKGIISKTDFENRKAKLQESYAKKISAENKWLNSKSELMNTEIELNAIRQDYNEKLMKSESDKFSTLSSLYDAEANLTKMQNELTNYIIRNNYYYVAAPQDGYITNSYVQGVGEIVKEGAPLVSVVPKNSSLSVEFYIEPIDMPLVHKNMRVQLTFDGWPAFVFSGWPGVSFGTYSGKIVAIDRSISPNGKFRVLAIPDKQAWPESLQVGGGVKSLTLLNNVPVVYEIWRKINGFPPEFYESVNTPTNTSKTDEKK